MAARFGAIARRRATGTTNAAAAPENHARRLRATSSLAVLGSAAVFAAYAVGYSETKPVADRVHADVAAMEQTPVAAGRQVGKPTTTGAALGQREPAIQRVILTPQASDGTGIDTDPLPSASLEGKEPLAATPASAYRDGTFVGKAEGGHGQVEVTLKISAGVIVSTEITSCLTRYPCSKIKALPGRVIARQSAAVDYVSGASDSSRAFRLAVMAALKQAQAG